MPKKYNKNCLVFKKSTNTYAVKLRINGKQVYKDTGTGDEKLANLRVDELKAKIKRMTSEGKKISINKNKSPLLMDIIENLLSYIKKRIKDRTYTSKIEFFMKIDFEYFKKNCKYISDMNDMQLIDKYIDWRADYTLKTTGKKYKESSFNVKLWCIARILGAAYDLGHLSKSVVDIKRLTVDNSIKKMPLLNEDYIKLVENTTSELFKVVLKLAVYSGSRMDELLYLKVKDVSVSKIFLAETKNGESRSIPICSELKELIEKLQYYYICHRTNEWIPRASLDNIRLEEYLFRHSRPNSEAQRIKSVKGAFNKSKKEVGLDSRIKPTSTRHGLIYRLASGDGDKNKSAGINSIRSLVGHNSVRSIESYLKKVSSVDLEPIVELIKWG